MFQCTYNSENLTFGSNLIQVINRQQHNQRKQYEENTKTRAGSKQKKRSYFFGACGTRMWYSMAFPAFCLT